MLMLHSFKSGAARGFLSIAKLREFAASHAGIYLRGSIPISLLVIFLSAISMITFPRIGCSCSEISNIVIADEPYIKLTPEQLHKLSDEELTKRNALSLKERDEAEALINKKYQELNRRKLSFAQFKREFVEYLASLPQLSKVEDNDSYIRVIFRRAGIGMTIPLKGTDAGVGAYEEGLTAEQAEAMDRLEPSSLNPTSERLSDEALEILDNSEPGQPTPLNEIILDNGQSVKSILDKYGSGPNSVPDNNKK